MPTPCLDKAVHAQGGRGYARAITMQGGGGAGSGSNYSVYGLATRKTMGAWLGTKPKSPPACRIRCSP